MNQLREIHTSAFLNHPYEALNDVVRRDPLGLLHRATDHAEEGERASATTDHPATVELDRELTVELTSIVEEPDGMLGPRTRFSLEFRASHHPELLSTMEATLDLLTLGPSEAQLDFVGKYRPRYGVVGAAVDRVIGHRLLDAAAHRFVESIAERLRVDAAS
jgi:hypothetical protein